jgi:hypothetical protein
MWTPPRELLEEALFTYYELRRRKIYLKAHEQATLLWPSKGCGEGEVGSHVACGESQKKKTAAGSLADLVGVEISED